ncbi:unnamed protein product [Diatraea saccharalis]|uniref:Uncharacterized protein n=1 Tax=Diatraea saccharalis TaxID=40085 RepID=A0A9N9RH83_9NEOP|nr:unnamed protein product [Diatraea saccharalis]
MPLCAQQLANVASYYAPTTALYHQRRRKEVMEVSSEPWRAYYSSGAEHPLSAATSAVLDVADEQTQPLEYYRLPPLAQDTHLNLHKDAKLVDVWHEKWALRVCDVGVVNKVLLRVVPHTSLPAPQQCQQASRNVRDDAFSVRHPRHCSRECINTNNDNRRMWWKRLTLTRTPRTCLIVGTRPTRPSRAAIAHSYIQNYNEHSTRPHPSSAMSPNAFVC